LLFLENPHPSPLPDGRYLHIFFIY
jgi:hypothetical protein